MSPVLPAVVLPALVLSGAIFGFFYAWVCSTMWGLDTLPPSVAIAAMQGMNASVRNALFAPAFFGTGPVLILTGLWLGRMGRKQARGLMVLAGLVYLFGAKLPTMLVNVPMNVALAAVDPGVADAALVWASYSTDWQAWNQGRTIASGVAFALAVWAVATAAAQNRALPKMASAT